MLDTHLEVKLKKQLQGEIPILCAYQKMKAEVILGDTVRKPFNLPPKEGAVLILLYRKGIYDSDICVLSAEGP